MALPLERFEIILNRGDRTSLAKRPARQITEDILEKLRNNGQLPLEEGIQYRIDFNDRLRDLGGFDIRGSSRANAVRYLQEANRALIDGMENSVGRTNPDWWNQYQSANQAYGVTQATTRLGNWMQKHLEKPLISDMAKVLFGAGTFTGLKIIPGVSLASLPLIGTIKAWQVASRMVRSPILREYYTRAISDAAAGNVPQFHKNIERFDEEAKKNEIDPEDF